MKVNNQGIYKMVILSIYLLIKKGKKVKKKK